MALQIFSTDRTPARDRAQLFQRQMQERFSVGLGVSTFSEQPLSTHVVAYCGRRLRFASLRFSPHRTYSAAAGQRASSRVLVTLQDEGTVHISQDGRDCRLGPGEFCVIEPERPFSIETTEMLARSVYLERETVRSVMPYLHAFTACAVNGRSGAGMLFNSMLNDVFKLAPTLDEDTADSIAEALPHVLAAAFGSVNKEVACESSRLKAFHKQRVLRFVRSSLHNSKLDAAAIARRVNLSMRYVYALFEDESEPLMKWVWSERLERCARDLAAPGLKGRTVGEIAYSWGFSDVAHFSRTFRQRFGVSPREWRRQGAAP